MRAVKYGVTRDYVLKLTVVLPDGRILTLGGNAKKSTSGYDLVSLFVGSEGTLGVVTEITLRLLGLPEQVGVAVAVFDTLAQAADAIYECVRYGLDASALELLDAATVHATNVQQGLALRVAPTVFTEFHGSDTVVEEGLAFFREVCETTAAPISAATSPGSASAWSAREGARVDEAVASGLPRSLAMCVPISQFGKMIAFAHRHRSALACRSMPGHAGDGNLHRDHRAP